MMSPARSLRLVGVSLAVALGAACSSSSNNNGGFDDGGGSGGDGSVPPGDAGIVIDGFGGDTSFGGDSGGKDTGTASDATSNLDAPFNFDGFAHADGFSEASYCTDDDGDGWTTCGGDCNDHDSAINPGAFDDMLDYVVQNGPNAGQIVDGSGNGIDDDCNGLVDDRRSCAPPDSATDATSFARALDVCENSNGLSTTVKNAGFLGTPTVNAPSGTTTDLRVTKHMGSTAYYQAHWPLPPGTGNMIFLSSGLADDDIDLPGTNNCSQAWGFNLAGGITLPAASCQYNGTSAINGQSINDYIDLKLTLHAPTNASAFTFDFSFFSEEWPNYVGSPFNDHFLAILTSPNHPYDNIAFDAQGKCVSVNNNYFQQCNTYLGAPSACSLGGADLTTSGFDVPTGCNSSHGSGSTGWLKTTAPVTKDADFTLELIVFDMTDAIFDSAFVADHFRWLAQPGVSPVTGR